MATYTPTEQRLLCVLSDGMPHAKDELVKSLPDDQAYSSLKMHLTRLRPRLQADSLLIYHSQGAYRMVKFLNSAPGTPPGSEGVHTSQADLMAPMGWDTAPIPAPPMAIDPLFQAS